MGVSSAAESPDEPDVEQPARDRILEALAATRALLGPKSVPTPPAAELLDEAELEARLDAALAELRAHVATYDGPDAIQVARTAYELVDLAWSLREQTIQRRLHGVTSVQQALGELRTVSSVELMLRRCTEVVCTRCGFDRAVMVCVEGEHVVAVSAFDRRDSEWESKIKHSAGKVPPPVLDHMLLETDMLRRRAPMIVRDTENNPRVFKALTELSAVSSYVAAPIVPEGRVIGFLHADVRYQSREVDIIDRDVLWAFAEGCGYALERTLLHDQVRAQRQQIRDMLRSADELIAGLGESELQIARAETSAATRAATTLSGGGSRIHALFTRREMEVMELLVNGDSNRLIAERLVVSEATVKSHVTHIFRKLRAGNRAEAVHRYMRLLALAQQ